jgi:hypothetical protein
MAAPCVVCLEPTTTRQVERHLMNGNGANCRAGFIAQLIFGGSTVAPSLGPPIASCGGRERYAVMRRDKFVARVVRQG